MDYAYNRSPRFGGKAVAVIRIVSVRLERTSTMPDSDYEGEGFAFLDGTKIGPHDATWEGFEAWRLADESMFVIRFELVRKLGVQAVEELGLCSDSLC